MAYLSDDELLDTEGGFTGWDDGTGAGAEETLEQALAEERLAELENELEQNEHPIDYEAELEDEEEEAAPVSEKRLKREIRACDWSSDVCSSDLKILGAIFYHRTSLSCASGAVVV